MTPKNFNLLSALGSMMVVIGAVLKIMHFPYANMIIFVGFIFGAFASYFYIEGLKRRIKQLEQELNSRN